MRMTRDLEGVAAMQEVDAAMGNGEEMTNKCKGN